MHRCCGIAAADIDDDNEKILNNFTFTQCFYNWVHISKLRGLGPTNGMVDNSDSNNDNFGQRLQSASKLDDWWFQIPSKLWFQLNKGLDQMLIKITYFWSKSYGNWLIFD